MKKYSKWFVLRNKEIITIKSATTIQESFEKTISKWELIMEGYQVGNSVNSCGLCDIFFKYNKCNKKCPLLKYNSKYSRGRVESGCCSAFKEYVYDIYEKNNKFPEKSIEVMYLYILLVKQAEGVE